MISCNILQISSYNIYKSTTNHVCLLCTDHSRKKGSKDTYKYKPCTTTTTNGEPCYHPGKHLNRMRTNVLTKNVIEPPTEPPCDTHEPSSPCYKPPKQKVYQYY